MSRIPLDWKSAYAAMHADHAAAFPPAALHYILEVIRKTALAQKRSAEAALRALTPEELIAAFKAAVRADFSPLAREVLEDWRLRTREDLGRAVVLLGDYRCLLLEPSDTLEAFVGDGTAGAPLWDEGMEK